MLFAKLQVDSDPLMNGKPVRDHIPVNAIALLGGWCRHLWVCIWKISKMSVTTSHEVEFVFENDFVFTFIFQNDRQRIHLRALQCPGEVSLENICPLNSWLMNQGFTLSFPWIDGRMEGGREGGMKRWSEAAIVLLLQTGHSVKFPGERAFSRLRPTPLATSGVCVCLCVCACLSACSPLGLNNVLSG